jgi:hypothetical protein
MIALQSDQAEQTEMLRTKTVDLDSTKPRTGCGARLKWVLLPLAFPEKANSRWPVERSRAHECNFCRFPDPGMRFITIK